MLGTGILGPGGIRGFRSGSFGLCRFRSDRIGTRRNIAVGLSRPRRLLLGCTCPGDLGLRCGIPARFAFGSLRSQRVSATGFRLGGVAPGFFRPCSLPFGRLGYGGFRAGSVRLNGSVPDSFTPSYVHLGCSRFCRILPGCVIFGGFISYYLSSGRLTSHNAAFYGLVFGRFTVRWLDPYRGGNRLSRRQCGPCGLGPVLDA
jgi:hypothetical protein